MAILLDTDFEGYAVGQGSLAANGWSDFVGLNVSVVSTPTHGGVRSLGIGHLGGGVASAFRWSVNDGEQRCVTVDVYAYKETPPSGVGRGVHFYTFNIATGLPGAGFRNALAGIVGNQTTFWVFNRDDILATVTIPIAFDEWHQYRLEMVFSTVNEAGDDVNADGCARLYVDGVQYVNLAGVRIFTDDAEWGSGINSYDSVAFDIAGYIDDVVINDDLASCLSGDLPPTPPGTPCCGDTLPDPRVPNAGPPTPVPLQPWDRECDGGGGVPTAADIVDDEVWEV